ncbi:probable cytochrome P450 6a21 [Musca vetustissima]|uniref:probable cytochrome P450 6a21 n=1 Tax=Musca vetustissima TaxID=27455 RepID=UPI002AB7662D|nr:probable cytochrome P450 6a21 [Musca vetustissima]
MDLTTILLATVVLLLMYLGLMLYKRYTYWEAQGVPCDRPNWLLGSLGGAMTSKTVEQILREYYQKYRNSGPFVGFYWFTKPAAFVTDPQLLKQILVKDFSKFTDRGLYCNEEDDPLSGNLFNLDGNKWRHMRTKLTPTFTSGKMKGMFPFVTKLAHDMVDVVGDRIMVNPILDVKDMAACFTIDVIGSCAFGLEMNCLRGRNPEFRNMCRRAFVVQRYGVLGLALRFGFPELAHKLHITETMPDVEKFFMGIVKDTVEMREKNNIKRNDFMDMLIDMKNNKLVKSEDGEELTNLTFGQIAAQAFVFILAGFETSSTTMSFALYELAQNQEAQQKAREEIEEVLGRHKEFSYECLKEMTYLSQVMQETLRLYTIVVFLNRQAVEDYPVPGNSKLVIKKGMPVIIPAGAIHRDERYFPEPNVFNPDNFAPEKVAARDSVLNLSFGDGPRTCIGMRFGKMQTMIGLALLLKHFKFSVCERTQIPMKLDKTNMLVSADGGVYLKVEKI